MSNTHKSVVLTTNCTCPQEEIENGVECYGFCFEETYSILENLIEEWREMNSHKASDEVRIDGEKMTWQRLDGHAIVDVSKGLTDAIIGTLSLKGGDWTLVFKLSEDGHLSTVRYSHDEPTGAGFSIGFVPEEVILV